MTELVLRPRIYDYHAELILAALREFGAAEELVKMYEREFEIARDAELTVQANWEMGIVQDFMNGASSQE